MGCETLAARHTRNVWTAPLWPTCPDSVVEAARVAAKRLRRLRDLIGAARFSSRHCGCPIFMQPTAARSKNSKLNSLPNASPLGGRDF